MKRLLEDVDWLKKKIKSFDRDTYFLFDCPGQAELFTHDRSLPDIVAFLTKHLCFRLTTINLIDVHYCVESARFVSALILALNSMAQMEQPHINVLSKCDLVPTFEEELPFPLDYYAQAMDLSYLVQSDNLRRDKFSRLNALLCELVGDTNLVSFCCLSIEDKESVSKLAKLIDKSNGFVFGGLTLSNESIMAVANSIE